MLGPISLWFNFTSQNFQVTFTETSSMFKILTKFHRIISFDIVRCLAILWLNSPSFKTPCFIISTFTFITEHLNCIYSLLTSLHHYRSSAHRTILHEISVSYRTEKIIPFINTSTILITNIHIRTYYKTNHSTAITLYSVANNESQTFSFTTA
jgi:hypothetical protein